MKIKPQHVHLCLGSLFLLGAIASHIAGLTPLAVLAFFGGIVALIHWKASKVGIIDL
ncbi:hypothetical protein [Pseudomonas baetica]|uniref:hypothetical protein n=1 Tax=Pseudomonas baetica TaxID=674054 RepID=UPI002406783B|nr:hypothetical protein [Pseudomonas baetica]MDF9779262.1 hypothetical protein [Pseudomonas baetica]